MQPVGTDSSFAGVSGSISSQRAKTQQWHVKRDNKTEVELRLERLLSPTQRICLYEERIDVGRQRVYVPAQHLSRFGLRHS